MQGSQYRNADGWTDNPLSGIIGNFMSSGIPSTFGPQDIPYLSAVTTTAGSGNNALAAVPTINIPVPFMVKTLISGDVDWVLEAGIKTGIGTLAPNDQYLSNKTWVAVG
jgi:hypothetical protein